MLDRDDPRSDDRDRGSSWDRTLGSRSSTSDRNRNDERDPRDVFTRDLDLPRERERRPVRERDHVYEINGTESRMLGTIGAFRVVSERDLHELRDDSGNPRRSVRHLEDEELIRSSPLSSDDRAVVLTERGRDLLEASLVKKHFGDVPLSAITATAIAEFQHTRHEAGIANRTINMDVGVLSRVLKSCGRWRALADHVKNLPERQRPVGRALTPEERKRLFDAAASNAEWEHVFCAAVVAANTSMRPVEVKAPA